MITRYCRLKQHIEQQTKKERSKVNRAIRQPSTRKRSVKDFPEVFDYLQRKFSEVDLSDIPIYIATNQTMANTGFEKINGCYYPIFDLILVKKNPSVCDSDGSGAYSKRLSKTIACALRLEDVVVHECLHAVSKKSNRSARFFTNGEEEFVFTNSIDFYKEQGMDESKIADECLIAFCVNNIVEDRQEMMDIFEEIKVTKKLRVTPVDRVFTEAEYSRFVNKHADLLVDIIVRNARAEAHKMIECYKSNQEQSTEGDFNLTLPTGRFAGIRYLGKSDADL